MSEIWSRSTSSPFPLLGCGCSSSWSSSLTIGAASCTSTSPSILPPRGLLSSSWTPFPTTPPLPISFAIETGRAAGAREGRADQRSRWPAPSLRPAGGIAVSHPTRQLPLSLPFRHSYRSTSSVRPEGGRARAGDSGRSSPPWSPAPSRDFEHREGGWFGLWRRTASFRLTGPARITGFGRWPPPGRGQCPVVGRHVDRNTKVRRPSQNHLRVRRRTVRHVGI
jgi:hypothetical protein